MSDETPATTDTAAAAAAPQVRMQALAQYVRDLSFENAVVQKGLTSGDVQPDIQVAVSLDARKRAADHQFDQAGDACRSLKMPDGGFVISFTDVTAERAAIEALRARTAAAAAGAAGTLASLGDQGFEGRRLGGVELLERAIVVLGLQQQARQAQARHGLVFAVARHHGGADLVGKQPVDARDLACGVEADLCLGKVEIERAIGEAALAL